MKESKNEDMNKCPICDRIYNVLFESPISELDMDGLKISNIKGDICIATEKYNHFKIYVYFHYVPENPTG